MTTTAIEWADKVWNPVIGCAPISEGCARCYARPFARRLAGAGVQGYERVKEWDGRAELVAKRLDEPGRWRKPAAIFVCSMADLFGDGVLHVWRDHVWRVMAAAERHRFLVLTKRPGSMRKYLENRDPLPNVWLGVSVENQARADERIPVLLTVPAAGHFVSYEPALGAVDFRPWLPGPMAATFGGGRLGWLIAGAETGQKARRADPDWFHDARRVCDRAGVPFFFKKDSDGRGDLGGVVYHARPW